MTGISRDDILKMRFKIFVHVYYPEIWEDMIVDIDKLVRQPFDLIVTRPAASAAAARPKSSFLGTVTELVVENRGRDVLPFLTGLRQEPAWESGIGLKLHTKCSPHRSDGNGWRQFLVASLLDGKVEEGLSGLDLMISEPRIGLIAPKAHLLPIIGRTSINGETMRKVLQRVESPITSVSEIETHRFAAGSMFWFRREAMMKVIEQDFTDLFIGEGGQLDGTAAHAFERLFAVLAEQEGYISAAMENVDYVLRHNREALSKRDLMRVIDESLSTTNPFALPLADFWRQYPLLLKVAHSVYGRLPKGMLRVVRDAVTR